MNPGGVGGWVGCEPLEEVWRAPFPQDWAARKSQRKKESGEGEGGKKGSLAEAFHTKRTHVSAAAS